MPFGYPAFLEVSGRRSVVVGAAAVAEGKVEALLDAGADDVLVLAEAPATRLASLERHAHVRVERRSWRPDDFQGATVVVASRSDPEGNAALAREARSRGALVNVMDDVSNCDFAAPAVVRRGDLLLAIGTGGASPALARRLREELSIRFGGHWKEVVEVLRQVREDTLPLLPDYGQRARRWREALDLQEAEELALQGRTSELRVRLVRRLVGQKTEGAA